MLYHYWLLRYVPDTARPDTVGVGVVVIGQDPTDLAVKVVRRYDEIPDIGGPRKEFAQELRNLESDLIFYTLQQEGFALSHTSSARSFVERLRRQNYGILRIDAPIPAAGESARWLCEFLFDRLVTRKQPEQRAAHRVTQIRSEAKDLYQSNAVVAQKLTEGPIVQMDRGSTKIDLAVLADSYQELTRAFSFAVTPTADLRDRGIAFAHNIGKLRNNGATVQGSSGVIHQLSPDKTTILALVEYPKTEKQWEVYEEATADWESFGIQQKQPVQMPRHVNDVALRLAA